MFKEKKVVIYGVGRFQMDFQCIFDTIEVAYYVSEDDSEQEMFGKAVRKPEYLQDEKEDNLLVIVCELDFGTIRQKLVTYGLSEEQIIYAEDLFPQLDNYKCDIEKEEVVMWGVGNTTKEFFERYDRIWGTQPNVAYFIDKDPGKEGSTFLEKPVKCVDNITDEEWKKHFIIIGTVFYEDVKKELCEKGLKEFEDFIYWSYALAKPSKMLSKIIRTESKKHNRCRMPFDTFWEININGVYTCALTWAVKMPIGDVVVQSLDEIWNGMIAKMFRLSLINHTFCFCEMDKCSMFNNGIERDKYYTAEDLVPSELPGITQVAIDDTCNLHCRMCREHVRGANEAHRKVRMKAAEQIMMSKYINQSKKLVVAGAGEVFASQVYDKILFGNPDIKRKSIVLKTNLMLFNKEKWEKLKKYYEDIRFEISVDGADKETFEYIRRGSSYEKLLEGFEFLSELRAKGEVSKVSFVTVVQRLNYKQVIPMMQMIENYGFDEMILCKILNWNMYSEEYFNENISMCEKDMKTFKPEFIKVVEQDEFKRLLSKMEFTGNMAENYYNVYLPNKEKNIC